MEAILDRRVPEIRIDRLTKTFRNGKAEFRALNGVSLDVNRGQMVALIGASGSGKSTMLRQIAGLSRADRLGGSVEALGCPVQCDGTLSRSVRAVRSGIGFVFQQFNIVNRLTVLQNVLAGALGRIPPWRGALQWFTREERSQALEALRRVGMEEFAFQRAAALSGGQQQRVAIARTLMQKARVILADEPIASLDPVSARNVMDILAQINREDGTTVVVSLHQVDYALRYCKRVIALRHGSIVYDGPNVGLTAEMLHDIYGDRIEESCLVPCDCVTGPETVRPAAACVTTYAGAAVAAAD